MVDKMVDNLLYGPTYGTLILETAIVAFTKANGAVRLMLCTRNLDTVKLMNPESRAGYGLSGFDARCNISNGNIAVVDLAIDECRSFNVERVITLKWLGELTTLDDLDKAVEEYEEALKFLREQGVEVEEAGRTSNKSGRSTNTGESIEMPSISF